MPQQLAVLTVIPFLLGGLLVLLRGRIRFERSALIWLLAGVIGIIFLLFCSTLPGVIEGEAVEFALPWVEALHLEFALRLDGLGLLFALVITGIGTVVTLYAGYYLQDSLHSAHDEDHHPSNGDKPNIESDDHADERRTPATEPLTPLGRFYPVFFAFMGAMLLLVLADNVITMFIAWELTSITSFLLIGFNGSDDANARIGSLRALFITGAGGLALFAGLILASYASGSYSLSDIISRDVLRSSPYYNAVTILVMLGAFTKSAQFPFHFWLPGAMSAPTPASAYLHSATMVKAGIYLLLRFYPVLGDTALWLHGLMGIGLITMFIGGLLALRQRDLKGLLAYSTVSMLGAMVAMTGLPAGHGLEAVTITILAHALYKATLFLLAGTIDHATGTRSLNHLGGLRQRMPGMFATAIIVSASMAGVIPLLGFISKEALLHAVFPEAPLTWLPLAIVWISSVFTVAAALIYVWDIFVRPAPDPHLFDHYHQPPAPIQWGPAPLAVATILGGLLVEPVIAPLVEMVTHHHPRLHLIPEGGLSNTTFQLSLGALAVGFLIFLIRRFWLALPDFPFPRGADVYFAVLKGLDRIGDRVLLLQNGRLRHYLIGILSGVGFFIILTNFVSGDILHFTNLTFTFSNPSIDLLQFAVLVVALGAAVATIIFRNHLLAALSMGVMGYSIGVIFLLVPAPDVALVQILVETLGTVLIILMIARISQRRREEIITKSFRSRLGIIRDIIVSGAIGIAVMLFALSAITNRPSTFNYSTPIALWHIQNTYSELGITDVVAGIVTDFRGMDTLFEIVVFSVASLGVLTILTLPRTRELITWAPLAKVPNAQMLPRHREFADELGALQGERVQSRLSTPLTRAAARLFLPFAMLIALSQILYGGNTSGDGFTAGVVVGLVIASWYVIFGYFEARELLSWLRPGLFIIFGLTLAFANALMPLLLGQPFLRTIDFGDGIAGLHLSSTQFFEIGIFLTVLGGASTVMEAIAHPREFEKEFYGDE
jgi:NADH:ubiquinone oxidoreductase subunit 5 (subunit L)/multisubunit Na+/H+ antiporter MnhA subunit/multisubunit Na+/H+ antiporter MnhB subunit